MKKSIWDILYPYRYFVTASLIIVFGLGVGFPLVLCKPLHSEEGFRKCLEHLYFLSGWFYSVTAFFTFFAVVAAAFFAYEQMKSMQDQLKQSAATNYQVSRQSAWSGIFSMTNLINDYIASHKDNIIVSDWEGQNPRL